MMERHKSLRGYSQRGRAITQHLAAVRAFRARQSSKAGVVPAQREGGSMYTKLRVGLCSTLLVIGLMGWLWGTADAAVTPCGTGCTCNTAADSNFAQISCLPGGEATVQAPCPTGGGILGSGAMVVFGVGGAPGLPIGDYTCPGPNGTPIVVPCINNLNPLNPTCTGFALTSTASTGFCHVKAPALTGGRAVVTCIVAEPMATPPAPPAPPTPPGGSTP
jgi:hypothetical protein